MACRWLHSSDWLAYLLYPRNLGVEILMQHITQHPHSTATLSRP